MHPPSVVIHGIPAVFPSAAVDENTFAQRLSLASCGSAHPTVRQRKAPAGDGVPSPLEWHLRGGGLHKDQLVYELVRQVGVAFEQFAFERGASVLLEPHPNAQGNFCQIDWCFPTVASERGVVTVLVSRVDSDLNHNALSFLDQPFTLAKRDQQADRHTQMRQEDTMHVSGVVRVTVVEQLGC